MCVGADGGGGGGRGGGSSRLSVERSFHWQDEEGEKIESIHRPPLLSFELSLSLAGIVSAWCFLSRERKGETRIVERKASEQFEEAQSRHERKITPPANARGHHSNSTRHDTLAGLAIALLAAAALLSPVTSELSH